MERGDSNGSREIAAEELSQTEPVDDSSDSASSSGAREIPAGKLGLVEGIDDSVDTVAAQVEPVAANDNEKAVDAEQLMHMRDLAKDPSPENMRRYATDLIDSLSEEFPTFKALLLTVESDLGGKAVSRRDMLINELLRQQLSIRLDSVRHGEDPVDVENVLRKYIVDKMTKGFHERDAFAARRRLADQKRKIGLAA